MSQRREVEGRLALYDDLAGILAAMRSFALAELHRVNRRAAAQAELVDNLSGTLTALAPALPAPASSRGDIWLLLGSVRGFCGSYNEDLLRSWRAAAAESAPTLLLGERLSAALALDADRIGVAGALGALDASAAVDRLLSALTALRQSHPACDGLMLCWHAEDGVRCERLLPIELAAQGRADRLPLTQEPVAVVAQKVLEHYCFHLLQARLLQAIRVENLMRLRQMDNALQHLERSGDALRRHRNHLRQEEIIEEIELIVQDDEQP